MNKLIIITLLTLLISSCTDINQTENKIAEIENLRAENDSLKKIVSEIKNKYVFDSLTVRDIPSYKNSYELNSNIAGEIVFVGYNKDKQNTSIIMIDSISYNPKKLYNPDTLKLKNGGFHYVKKMDAERVYWKMEIQTEHQYGKKFEGILTNAAQVKIN
ncbi:hypothetical protein GCM10007962_32730 [Yeosuana aromativorans]|uniref:Uncharacterized protein n=1 Tax=Yeosuana aromativorans TaxID=288019 RepID=A0A8J3BSG1_9FLAO|nr:hypothetical protein [Yeosuana aromativorans]GGK35834.1 hypothetical protein GCM10007962_32730 [Yeosuana aromativorans]